MVHIWWWLQLPAKQQAWDLQVRCDIFSQSPQYFLWPPSKTIVHIFAAGVHDSYWTHACDVDEMNRILREKFVELYEKPILENVSAYSFFSFFAWWTVHWAGCSSHPIVSTFKLLIVILFLLFAYCFSNSYWRALNSLSLCYLFHHCPNEGTLIWKMSWSLHISSIDYTVGLNWILSAQRGSCNVLFNRQYQTTARDSWYFYITGVTKDCGLYIWAEEDIFEANQFYAQLCCTDISSIHKWNSDTIYINMKFV